MYWIPETVLERVEDSIAEPISGELLFEDGSGNQYRRLRKERGDLDYGPFDSPPVCKDHLHPPETGNYVRALTLRAASPQLLDSALVVGPFVDGGLAGAYEGSDNGVARVGRQRYQRLAQLVGG